ncbi:MAG: NAD(P)-dependent alcohol dehydrogenase [Woeseiaceae bacterium]|nr:NAD(P)-dependent alcohol dehydrogenase [Woeseiaceae bacterium]
MKLRYKILSGASVALLLVVAAAGFTLSYTADCEPYPGVSSGEASMKAFTYTCYGSPDVLEFSDVPKPEPGANEVLVKVRAAGVNPYDWHNLRGSPYFMRLGTGIGKPKETRLGVDFAGVVEEVGVDVTAFSPGDAVFGGAYGAFAEYVLVAEDRAIAPKPANVSFREAAGVGIAGITAMQALTDSGKLQAGEKVLINGASGGVGTFAVQIAKAMGAEVTGVCSTRNVDLVLALGADRVLDYKKEDYTDSGSEFDLIVDMVGNHSVGKNRTVLAPAGRYVIVGGPSGDWLGPLMPVINAAVTSLFVDQQLGMMIAKMRDDDLAALAELMQDGKVRPQLDRTYSLADVPEAIRYSETGRARGKIIIDVDPAD